MATLTPVDFNPFASATQGAMPPSMKLTPVDFNPFAEKPQAPEYQAGIPRTILDQSLQGATFGFADEVTDRIGAGIASLVTGEKYGDLLQEARNMSKERMAAQLEQNPGTSIVSNLAGGLLTGGAAASTKAGGAIANSLRTGGTAARIGKGVASGAATGALYGAGAADDGQRLKGAGQGAVLGGMVGGAVPAVGAAVKSSIQGTKNLIGGALARGAEALDDSASAIYQKSSQAYKQMRDAGAVFKPKTTQKIVSSLDTALKNDGPLNSALHDKTISVIGQIKDAAKTGSMSLEEIDQWRRVLGEVAGNFTDKTNARKASLLINTIDDAVGNLSGSDLAKGGKQAIEALKLGRSEYARARKFETIADIVKKADGDANYLKRELKKLLDNPKKVRGFNANEIVALKQASTTSAGEGIMKMLGKFGIDFGNSRIGNTALPVIGGLATGSPILPTIGTAARYGQKAIAGGKAETLLKTIEGNAPRVSVSNPSTLPPALSTVGGGVVGTIEGRGAQSLAPTTVMTPPVTLPGATAPSSAIVPSLDSFKPRSDAGENILVNLETDPLTEVQDPVQGALSQAAEVVGVDSELLRSMAQAESALDPSAKAKTSTASGLMQITYPTWKALVKEHGKEYGVGMADIMNPKANALMGAVLTRKNTEKLTDRLGREPDAGEIYMAHFLGANGAMKLLKAPLRADAADIFPKEAKANEAIFYDKNRPRTVYEVQRLLRNKVAPQSASLATS